MATYSRNQMQQYYEYLNFQEELDAFTDRLEFLRRLQVRHLGRASFNSVVLHYSPHRQISLDPEDLFDKIVVKNRGGYCMEVNTFFAAVLRTLGFQVYSAGGRVKHDRWSHMVNLVTIDGTKYLVDVGFGSKEPVQPVPLKQEGYEFDGICKRRCKLALQHIPQHTNKNDPSQRLWVYSVKDNTDPHADWEQMYSFTEVEFFDSDFEVMNYFVSTKPQSWFVQQVVAFRLMVDEETDEIHGELILNQDYVRYIENNGTNRPVVTLRNEAERIAALQTYFDMVLTEREKKGIKGLVSELKG